VVTITFLNQKGGVGKTSSCFHLAGTLSRIGHRVLLIDNDPQASLTQGFFGPDATRAIGPDQSVAALFEPDADPAPEALIVATGFPGISIVPGSIALTRWNKMPDEAWPDSERGVRSFIEAVGSEAEICLVDCPPNLHLCSWAALVASDFIVVPLQPEDFGSQGLAPVRESVAEVQGGPNPSLQLAGFLLTMYDKRLAVHTTYESTLRDLYGDAVFRNVVPRAKDFVEAVTFRKPLAFHKPKCAPAKALEAVALEMLARVGLADDAETRGAA
jgi:chromosome partitioning protein